MLRLSLALISVIALFAAILFGNTVRQHSHQVSVERLAPLAVDEQGAAERLAGAVRLRTISLDNQPNASGPAFRQFHEYLARSYPNAHRVMQRESVNEFSLLYTWPGRDHAARPIVLLAHQDVVPVAPGTERDWTHPPFDGVIADGHVWGRGAWDNKGNLCAIMEAIEHLAAAGFVPPQTVYVVSGHDEEMGTAGGQQGARAIAALLESRGVHAAFALDEGLLVTHGVMAGLRAPVALVGVAEKGYLTLSLSTRATPGHSSFPSQRTAIGALSTALSQLEQHPAAPETAGVTAAMLDTLAPEFEGLNRLALSNAWLLGPLVRAQMEAQPAGRAMLRTTTALTTFHAGDKENTLPGEASAHVNFRLLPGDTSEAVVERVRQAVHDETILVRPQGPSWPASKVSTTDAPGYRRIERTIREVFPGAVVAPGLMVGATDSRYFERVADQTYRFSPVRASPQDLPRFHGTDERVSIANFADMIRFYHRLLSAPQP